MADTEKKTYYLPKKLTVAFADWCRPGRDYSSKVAGAMLLWMVLEPAVRETLVEWAYSDDVEKAKENAGRLLADSPIGVTTRQDFLTVKAALEEARKILDFVTLDKEALDAIRKLRPAEGATEVDKVVARDAVRRASERATQRKAQTGKSRRKHPKTG